jgi:peptide chain release factor 3
LAGRSSWRAKSRRAAADALGLDGGRAHGTSVSPAVMSFEHRGLAFNLLDTPGHWDFSPRDFNPLGF